MFIWLTVLQHHNFWKVYKLHYPNAYEEVFWSRLVFRQLWKYPVFGCPRHSSWTCSINAGLPRITVERRCSLDKGIEQNIWTGSFHLAVFCCSIYSCTFMTCQAVLQIPRDTIKVQQKNLIWFTAATSKFYGLTINGSLSSCNIYFFQCVFQIFPIHGSFCCFCIQ